MPRLLALLLLVVLAHAESATAAAVRVGPNPSAVAFFEERIRPVLQQHCHECHAGGKKRGGLHVDSLEALLRGGHDEGPAVIPGDIVRSALLRSLRWEGDSDLNMPPLKQLPPGVIRDFERWVEIGAPWPDAAAPVAAPAPVQAPTPLAGRLHPIVVHLPIACLALAVLAELLVLLRGERWRPATALLVAAGTAGAAAAVATGTLLAGGQDPELLQRHQLLGWLTLGGGLAAAGWLALSCRLPLRRWPVLALLLLTALLAGAAGHVGGQMSWGRDWLPF